MLEVGRGRISWHHVGGRLGHVVTHVSLHVQPRTKPIGHWRRTSHDHGHVAWVQMVAILNNFIPFISPLLTSRIILLLLLDLVSLVGLTPRVVSRRSSVDKIVFHPRPVLARPKHGEVGLERFQQFVHHVAAGRASVSSTEGVVL